MRKKQKKRIIKILFMLIIFFILLIKFDPIYAITDYSNYSYIEIQDENDEVIETLISGKRLTYISLDEIPVMLQAIVISHEDKHFYSHTGFDTLRIIKALYNNVFKDKFEGASTITQQYIKNNYFSNEQKLERKIKELILSIKLEQTTTKEEILERYLNTIYFGENIYGVYDAASYYFNQTPADLSISEMALLYAMLKAPNLYSPTTNYDLAINKRNEILANSYHSHLITEAEYNEAISEDIKIYHNITTNSSESYYIDVIKSEYKTLGIKSHFEEKHIIKTKYSKELNTKIDEEYQDTSVDYSLVSSTASGYLRAIIGGKSYQESTYNIAINGNRDIGSSVKPILYYEALKCGIPITTKYYSNPLTINGYTYTNYHDLYPSGAINMKYALATSDNIYALKTHLNIGTKTLANRLNKLGIQAEAKVDLALGNCSTSLLKLTQIYGAFQNEGIYKYYKGIVKITNGSKNLYIRKIKQNKLLDKELTTTVTELMKGMFDTSISNRVTGKTIKDIVPKDTCGKSGLTDYDSYMIGFTTDQIVGVWVGYSDNQLLESLNHQALAKKLFATAILISPSSTN